MKSETNPPKAVPAALFRTIGAYVDFGPADSALLATFWPHVEPHLHEIIDDFYRRIEADPDALRVITGGSAQIERLKKTLRDWLARVLRGPHDETFAESMANIGRRHVQVGLDQTYMVGGMSVFREHLNRILIDVQPRLAGSTSATQHAFVKILDVVLALMLGTYHEVQQQKLLAAEQNARVRRLAAIGEMAASIAHEVRNPLAGISGGMQLLRHEFAGDSGRLALVNDILAEVGRLDARINDLLVYARPAALRPVPTRPAELLRSTVRLVAEDPRFSDIGLEVEAGDLPSIVIDAAQIQQVLVNLLLNAAQATRQAGEGPTRRTILLEARPAGAGVEIAVADGGAGVPPEIAGEIFKPFFTTRRDGTGLGLAISRRIVEAHGGALDFTSTPGGGTRFFFTLPGLPLPEPSAMPRGL